MANKKNPPLTKAVPVRWQDKAWSPRIIIIRAVGCRAIVPRAWIVSGFVPPRRPLSELSEFAAGGRLALLQNLHAAISPDSLTQSRLSFRSNSDNPF